MYAHYLISIKYTPSGSCFLPPDWNCLYCYRILHFACIVEVIPLGGSLYPLMYNNQEKDLYPLAFLNLIKRTYKQRELN